MSMSKRSIRKCNINDFDIHTILFINALIINVRKKINNFILSASKELAPKCSYKTFMLIVVNMMIMHS